MATVTLSMLSTHRRGRSAASALIGSVCLTVPQTISLCTCSIALSPRSGSGSGRASVDFRRSGFPKSGARCAVRLNAGLCASVLAVCLRHRPRARSSAGSPRSAAPLRACALALSRSRVWHHAHGYRTRRKACPRLARARCADRGNEEASQAQRIAKASTLRPAACPGTCSQILD